MIFGASYTLMGVNTFNRHYLCPNFCLCCFFALMCVTCLCCGMFVIHVERVGMMDQQCYTLYTPYIKNEAIEDSSVELIAAFS